MCTYNDRTLRTEDDLDRQIDEADQIEWDITGLYETYKKGRGCQKLEDTGCVTDEKGLAFLIHPKIENCLTDLRHIQTE